MEINIDEKEMQNVLNEQAVEGVKAVFKSYSIKSVLEKTISDSVLPALITEAIVNSVSHIDMDKLSQKLAEEIAKATTSAVQAVVQESMIEILVKLKGVPSYEPEKLARARAEIINTVFNTKKG